MFDSIFEANDEFDDFLKSLAEDVAPEDTAGYVSRLGGWADAIDGKIVNQGKYGNVPTNSFLDHRQGLHQTLEDYSPEKKNEFLLLLAGAEFSLDMLTQFIRTAAVEMTVETANTLVKDHLERIVAIPVFIDPMSKLIGSDFLPEEEDDSDEDEDVVFGSTIVTLLQSGAPILDANGNEISDELREKMKEAAKKFNVPGSENL